MARRILSTMGRFLITLEGIPPFVVAVGFVFYSGFLLISSGLLGLAFLKFRGKEVGYVSAPNWTFSMMVFFPLALLFFLLSLSRMRSLLTIFVNNRMIVNSNNTPVSQATITAIWDRYLRIASLSLIFLLAIFAVLPTTREVFHASPTLRFGSLANHGGNIDEAQKKLGFEDHEADWSWGAWIDPTLSAPFVVGFTSAVFLTQVIAISIFFLYVVTLITFATLLWRLTEQHPNTTMKLIPQVDSDDPRRGFQIFSPFIENIILTAIFFCCALFMTRLQRVYLANPEGRNFWEFVAQEIGAGFLKGVVALFKGDLQLFEMGIVSFGSAVATFTAAVILMMVILIPTYVLRMTAMRSRDQLVAELGRLDCDISRITNRPVQDVRVRLTNMIFYPSGYPHPIHLLGMVILGGGCFVFYRFTLLFAGFAFFLCVRSFVQLMRREARNAISTP